MAATQEVLCSHAPDPRLARAYAAAQEAALKKERAENRRLEAALKKKDAENRRLEKALAAERGLWKSDATADRASRGERDLIHALESFDMILRSEKKICACTGLRMDEYEFLAGLYDEEIERLGKTPLFRDEGRRASDPGNRCKLRRRHALLLELIRLRTGLSQWALGAIFAVDQSAVSRYLALDRRVLEKVLPTARTISKAIAACRTSKQVQEFIPGGKDGLLLLDGVRNPHVRPKDKEKQKEMYSGKVKRHSVNTLVGTNRDDVIVWISGTRPGSAHDITMVEELARTFPGMGREGGARIRVLADTGFQGILNRLPGIDAVIPKKRPPGGSLTEKEKAGNKRISSRRVKVEHCIGRTKNYQIMNRPYDGTPAEFNRDLNVVTGIVNYRALFPQIRRGTGVYGRLMAERRRRRLERPPRR